MNIQIKKYADDKELKQLKYIFVDALDVDPTFVRYEEEYNYCKSIPGLLEAHIELTPFSFDKNQWDENYWTNLKMDLIKNFSDRRMMHMREVAKVFLAEKVDRLLDERSSVVTPTVTPVITPDTTSGKTEPLPNHVEKNTTISRAEQERELEEAKRKLEEENRKVEAARQADTKRIEQKQMQHQPAMQDKSTGDSSKKVIGIAMAALAVIVIILILILK